MTASSFQEVLNSRIFKFIVGEEVDGGSSEFFVHEKVISQLSQPLYILTNGTSPEARAGVATWKNVSKESFERFVQFAYTGDYSIPKTTKRVTLIDSNKGVENVSAHPLSPITPNGIRRLNGSHESDDASTIEIPDEPVVVSDNTLHRQPTSEKFEDEAGGLVTNSNTLSKKHRKKKGRLVAKVSSPEPPPIPEPEPELVLDGELEPEPELELAELQHTKLELSKTGLTDVDTDSTPLVTQNGHVEQVSQTLAPDFHSISYPLLAPRDNYLGTCEPVAEFEKDHSYSNVLLSHASLYVLGDSRLIDSLKALALFKLHKTLCIFQLDKENIGDVTDLARYAYSEKSKHLGQGIGELRELVCQYMAIHAVELSADAKFMNLLAEGGQIVKDFFKYQLQRIN